MIANGNNLNIGWLYEVWDTSIASGGYRNPQGAIALADLNNNGHYYLIHSFTDSFPGSNGAFLYNPSILNTYIDMTANGGLGNVIYKNLPIVKGDLSYTLPAVRHGNGKYWWILIQEWNTNCFYKVLLNDTGFYVLPNQTCAGKVVADTTIACSSSFSPDGSKFAQFNVTGGVNIFDFDRCSGELSNPLFFPLDTWDDSLWFGTGVSFSPDSRFLYVSATKRLFQFDLKANDIIGSVDTVGRYDGYRRSLGSYFFSSQLAPDGKIYISCGNADADYHVINNPNGKGDSCNFVQHGVILPTPSGNVPCFPNYRLGALPGSACDTLSGLNEVQRSEKEHIIRVYPNPATDYPTNL
jgi:hypothetical protein